MEGRAIARPNVVVGCGVGGGWWSFNGGPGNCPAKPSTPRCRPSRAVCLQWRAGQLPGQTRARRVGDAPGVSPSMEGRAIARPNHLPHSRRSPRRRPFNGGPGNCPAKRPVISCSSHRCGCTFNGGPGNCPAKPPAQAPSGEGCAAPSMEGRAIARPNHRGLLGLNSLR